MIYTPLISRLNPAQFFTGTRKVIFTLTNNYRATCKLSMYSANQCEIRYAFLLFAIGEPNTHYLAYFCRNGWSYLCHSSWFGSLTCCKGIQLISIVANMVNKNRPHVFDRSTVWTSWGPVKNQNLIGHKLRFRWSTGVDGRIIMR
jgi:hypothetical protein